MISVVIPSYNENPKRLQTTVDTLRETTHSDLEILVIDDESEREVTVDGAEVVRNDEGIGAMQSINKGLELAHGAYLFSCDSHMRFIYDGSLDLLRDKCEEDKCIASLPSCKYRHSESTDHRGCYLTWNRSEGLQPRWRENPNWDKKWEQIPCMMGADYMMSRETMVELKESTGEVWDNTEGRWGFGEESMAVKCFMLDIPIYVANSHFVPHYYRKVNPLAKCGGNPTKQKWWNICYTMALYMEDKEFDRRMKPLINRHINSRRMEILIEKARSKNLHFSKSTEVPTHPLGADNNMDGQHHDWEWLESAMDGLDGLETAAVWRPGEHVFQLRDKFPDAEIYVKDFSKPRDHTWMFIIDKMDGVHWDYCSIQDYTKPPVESADACFICGDFKDECRKEAEKITDGPIIESDTNLRDQLDRAERRREQRIVDNY